MTIPLQANNTLFCSETYIRSSDIDQKKSSKMDLKTFGGL